MVGAKYLVLPPTPANWKAALKSLPWVGPTARSSVEKLKLGVTTEVMMPLSWLCPWMPERKASVWKTLRVLSLKVVMPDRES